MRPTLRQLEIFASVAKHLSFSKAASLLHLPQPAVSMQVKQLEECLGAELIETSGRRAHLTEAGRQVLNHIPIIQQQIEALEAAIVPNNGQAHGTLHLSIATSAQAIVFQLLGHFTRQNPQVLLDLAVLTHESITKNIHKHSGNLILSLSKATTDTYESMTIVDFNYVLCASTSHHLTYHRSNLQLQHLAGNNFILGESYSPLHDIAKSVLGDYIKTLRFMHVDNDSIIKLAIANGLGVSILPDVALMDDIQHQGIVALNLKGLPIPGTMHLLKRKNVQLNPAEIAFCRFVMNKQKTTTMITA